MWGLYGFEITYMDLRHTRTLIKGSLKVLRSKNIIGRLSWMTIVGRPWYDLHHGVLIWSTYLLGCVHGMILFRLVIWKLFFPLLGWAWLSWNNYVCSMTFRVIICLIVQYSLPILFQNTSSKFSLTSTV